LGDAFGQPVGETTETANIEPGAITASEESPSSNDDMGLSESDKALDLSVISSGNLTDEVHVSIFFARALLMTTDC
jgi:hypothetical protein